MSRLSRNALGAVAVTAAVLSLSVVNAAGQAAETTTQVPGTPKVTTAEVKGEGITVNAVLPTTIDHPVNRAQMPKADPKLWPSPHEVASVIVFLSSPESSGVSGAAIPITART